MPRHVTLEIKDIRNVIMALRKKCLDPAEEKNNPAATLCYFHYQVMGRLSKLDIFMRNARWIRDEILNEQKCSSNPKDYHKCTHETCSNPCLAKYCVACWKDILSEIHGEPEHTVCKGKAPEANETPPKDNQETAQ